MTMEKTYPEFFRDVYCGFHIPKRWEPLVERCVSQIAWRLGVAQLPLDTFQITQGKDKFGGLRLYYKLGNGKNAVAPVVEGYIDGVVSMAEALSFDIK